MAFVIKKDRTYKIYLPEWEKEWVVLAALDLAADISRLCAECVLTDKRSEADIVISTDRARLCRDEEFVYVISDEEIGITGYDDLGTMWGIYTFLEKELKIPPCYLFDGNFPAKRDRLLIEEHSYTDYPKTKFRGWFVNDEDLLSGYRHFGERDIDYRFYKKVIAPELMERIVKTALRNRINLIIPSTLVDIRNPYEEALVAIVAAHGLYVSQHHIEPLGVSHFGMSRFLSENGYPSEISYVTNREGMEAAWRYYVSRWARYPRVYYQLGLRGSSDIPVWVSDKNVGESDEERGALISSAIEAQHRIVKECTAGDGHTSTTVWMESAALLGKGLLGIPTDTTLVFADIGASQMFGSDFFSVKRDRAYNYGVYYHAGYWNVGSHLAEGVIPEKMQYSYRLAQSTGDRHYSVLNVANIKEFTFSISQNAHIVWDAERFDYRAWLGEYVSCMAPGKEDELSEAIGIFFSAFADVGREEYKAFCKNNSFSYIDHPDIGLPIYALNDGFAVWYMRRPQEDNAFNYYNPNILPALKQAMAQMKRAANILRGIYDSLEGNIKEAFGRHWLYQALYWCKLSSAACELALGIESLRADSGYDMSPHYSAAAEYLSCILAYRKEFYFGEWEDWFIFDTKLDIPRLCGEMAEKGKGESNRA